MECALPEELFAQVAENLVDTRGVDALAGCAAAASAERLCDVSRDDVDALEQSEVSGHRTDGGVDCFANVAVVAVWVGGEVTDESTGADAREDCGRVSRNGECLNPSTIPRRSCVEPRREACAS